MFLLEAVGCPADKLRVISSFYFFCVGYSSGSQGLVAFLRFVSGIIQGYHLSGTMFVLAIDAPIRMMVASLQDSDHLHNGPPAILRACADDLGAPLHCVKQLRCLYNTFQLCEWATGLTLYAKKCIRVCAITLSFRGIACVKDYIKTHMPAWSDFLIKDYA